MRLEKLWTPYLVPTAAMPRLQRLHHSSRCAIHLTHLAAVLDLENNVCVSTALRFKLRMPRHGLRSISVVPFAILVHCYMLLISMPTEGLVRSTVSLFITEPHSGLRQHELQRGRQQQQLWWRRRHRQRQRQWWAHIAPGGGCC